MKDIILAQLDAAEASVKAARALFGAWAASTEEEPAPEPDAPGGVCRHPEAKRIAAPTMGRPDSWVCGVCGFNGGEPQ